MNWYVIHPAVTGALTLMVGCYPYLQRPNRQTRLFAFSNLALAVWNFAELAAVLPIRHSSMVLFDRLEYIAGTLTVWFFFRFTVEFAGVPLKHFDRLWKWLLGIGILFILSSPTPFLIRDLDQGQGFFREIPGPGLPLFLVYLMGSLSLALYHLARQYPRSTGDQQNQIRYMALALSFPLLEGLIYFLSLYTPSSNLPYYASWYFQVAYVVLVAYAILSHHLMDIRIVIRRTLIYSLTSATLTALCLFFMVLMTRFTMAAFSLQLLGSAALSAVAITFLFHPLIQRIQNWVDRHFPRESLAPALLREATSGFVHEIKRPLANITVPAELALMDIEQIKRGKNISGLIPKLEDRLRYIMNQSAEAAQKIEAIRNIWQTSTAPQEPLSLDRLVKRIIDNERPLLDKLNVALEVSIPNETPQVRGNERQLEIVLVNLFKNAREAMAALSKERERKLSISLQLDNSQAVLRIKDSGLGIAADDLPKLFLPYFSTKGAKGMGVGLYLAKEIIRAHRGSLEAQSEEGWGAEFIVKLPTD